MPVLSDDTNAAAQKIIRLYGLYARTHAHGRIRKPESIHCHAAAEAWRTMLRTIERLQAAQANGGEKSRKHEAAG